MNYLFLPGKSGNYASTPDSVALSITGDIDISCLVAMDTYRPAAAIRIMAKDKAAASNSWLFALNTSGSLGWTVSADGGSGTTVSSGAVIGTNAGTRTWLRVTWRASDGRTQFFTSSDGVTWIQNGSDQIANVGSIHDNDSPIELGGRILGTADLWPGKLFYAEIRNGIAGSIVANPDFRGYVSSGFSDSAGNVWTVNQSATPPVAQIMNRAPSNHLFLPGKASNYARTPDNASISVTGDIDVRCYLALNKWNIGLGVTNTPVFFSKYGTATHESWTFWYDARASLNKIKFSFSTDGTNNFNVVPTTTTVFNNETAVWVRFTRVQSTGSGTFYTSSDGVTWAQVGSPVVAAAGVAIFDSDQELAVGNDTNGLVGDAMTGKVYYAELRNGIAGTIVASPDFRSDGLASGFSDAQGNVWTVNTSGSPAAALVSRTQI